MPEPLLTVVVAVSAGELPTPGGWEAWARGDDGRGIEVILVHAGPASAVTETGRLRSVVAPPGTPVPRLRALGVHAARAKLVALTEGFCRPAGSWANELIGARARTDALAVGGPMGREGGSARAWALTLVEYGRFFRAQPEGPVADLPATNVSYDRARLLELLGEDLGELAEPHVHDTLRAAGETLWRVPAARMNDVSDRPLGEAVAALYHHGRLYGGNRVAATGVPVRLLRCLASPLGALAQLARIANALRAERSTSVVLRCLPPLVLLLAAWALGEGTGSLLGPGDSAARWS